MSERCCYNTVTITYSMAIILVILLSSISSSISLRQSENTIPSSYLNEEIDNSDNERMTQLSIRGDTISQINTSHNTIVDNNIPIISNNPIREMNNNQDRFSFKNVTSINEPIAELYKNEIISNPTAAVGTDVLDFHGDTYQFNGVLDATPTGDTHMIYDSWGGTWCDAEKVPSDDGEGNPSPNNPGDEDDLLCWAAAASNILQWTVWGQVGGMSNTDEIFDHFQDHWYDDGGWPKWAWDWWFDGTENAPSNSYVDVGGGGGFYTSVNFGSYFHENSIDSEAMSTVDDYHSAGYGTTLLIYGPGGHAITCWGFNHATGNPSNYVGIWITDSDDSKSQSTPPNLLRYYEVSLISGKWYLQNYYGSNAWYIGAVQALERKPNSGITIINPINGEYIRGTEAITGTAPGDSGSIEIMKEDFEGSWPGSWTIGDTDSSEGYDYWGDNNYRYYGGGESGWCADYGSQTTKTTLFTENFEGSWPNSWNEYDSNSNYGYDYWGKNSYRSHDGSYSGWCADEGMGTSVIYTQNFDSLGFIPGGWTTYSAGPDSHPWSMKSDSGFDYRAEANSDEAGSGTDITEWIYMTSTIDASTYTYLELEFYLDYNYFDGDEYARVLYATSSSYPTFYSLDTWTSDESGTQYIDLSAAAGDSGVHIAFIYHGTYDWYMRVDDLVVSGGWSNTAVHKYDNGMESWMIRGPYDLSDATSGKLNFYYWLDSQSGSDYFQWMASPDGTNFNGYQQSGDLSGSGWIYKSYDLSDYNGFGATLLGDSSIWVAFRFESDSSGVDEGAYVDDIELVIQEIENNIDSYSYDDDMTSYMYKQVDLGDYDSASLKYYYWTHTEQNYDWLRVYISQDGSNWDKTHEISGDAQYWQSNTIPLDGYCGDSTVWIKFSFESDGSVNSYEGVYLDNIILTGNKNLNNIKVRIDSGSWITATGSTSWLYNLDTTQLTDGTHTISARAYYGLDYSVTSVDIIVDNTLPSNPNNINSNPPKITWTNINTISISWSGALDSTSGIDGYSYDWTQSTNTVPSETIDTSGTSMTSSPLSDGSSWYFHVRAVDKAGNWATGAYHYGPFKIDTIAPTNPSSCSQTVGSTSSDVWQNTVYDPSFSWSGASDSTSNIAGYYYYWGTSDSGQDTSFTISAGHDPSSVGSSSEAVYYLRINTKDNAGNLAGWTTVYSFKYDGAIPTNPGTCIDENATNDMWTNDRDPSFEWSGAADSGSGLKGYDYYWGTNPSGTSPSSYTITEFYDPSVLSGSSPLIYYLRIKTEDVVGNWASWATIFTYKFEQVAPTNPTILVSNPNMGQWSNDDTIEATWSGANDTHSGINGYYYSWTQNTGGNPTGYSFGGSNTIISSPLGEGNWYLNVRTKDKAGNLANGYKTWGPFKIDQTDPYPSDASSAPSSTIFDNSISIIRLNISWEDPQSDINSVWFRYKFGSSDEFSTNKLSTANASGYFWYDIPTSIWRECAGKIIYWESICSNNAGAQATCNEQNGPQVLDDDTTAPVVTNEDLTGDLSDHDTCNYFFNITGSDLSGWKLEVKYYYTDQPATVCNLSSQTMSGVSTTLSVMIPKSQWIAHIGYTIRWTYRLTDLDSDRTGDGESTAWTSYADAGSISDDDSVAPVIHGTSTTGNVYDNQVTSLELIVNASDSSGWTVDFEYKYSDALVQVYSVNNSTMQTGAVELSITILYNQWIQHVGSTIYWRYNCTDQDMEGPNDGSSTHWSSWLTAGQILDDDTQAPASSNNQTDPSGTFGDNESINIRFNITWTDDTGIANVQFRFRGGIEGDWSSWKSSTGYNGDVYYIDLPKTIWMQYSGEQIQWQSKAYDNDNDNWIGDSLVNTSATFTGPNILDLTFPEILSRSVNPKYYAPKLGQVTIKATFSEWVSWTVTVENDTGAVKTFVGEGNSLSQKWNGSDDLFEQLPEGTYTIYLNGLDKVGHPLVEKSITVIIDRTRPKGSFTIEDDAEYSRKKSVSLQLSGSDMNGVAGFFVANKEDFIDGQWFDYTSEIKWNLTGGEGTCTVYVRFVDSAGLESKICIDCIILDLYCPVGNIIIEDGDKYTTDTSVIISLSAFDNSEIRSYKISNDDAFTNAVWKDFESEIVWELEGGEGKSIVYVMFKDAVGRVSAVCSDSITVDMRKPRGSVFINNGAMYTHSRSVTLSFQVTDKSSEIWVWITNNPPGSRTESGSWIPLADSIPWQLEPGEGPQTVYVRFKDGAGLKSGYFNASIVLDLTPPVGSISINQGAGFANTTSVMLYFDARDDNGITKIRISNNSDFINFTDVAYCQYYNWTLVFGEGHKSVYVMFRDSSGLWSDAINATIIFDRTPPEVSVTSIEDEEVLNMASYNLEGYAIEQYVQSILFSLDGDAWLNFSTSNSWVLPLNSLSEGYHSITILCIDKAGNRGEITIGFEIDTIPPVLDIEYPAADTVTNNRQITVTGTTEPGLRVTIGHMDAIAGPDGQFSILISLEEGELDLEVVVTDNAGNTNLKTRKIIVDWTNPAIENIEYVVNEGKDSITISCEITDDNINHEKVMLVYRVGNEEEESVQMRQSDGKYVAEVEGDFSRWEVTYHITATDLAGNAVDRTDESIDVTEGDGSSGGGDQSFTGELSIVTSCMIILVMIIVLVFALLHYVNRISNKATGKKDHLDEPVTVYEAEEYPERNDDHMTYITPVKRGKRKSPAKGKSRRKTRRAPDRRRKTSVEPEVMWEDNHPKKKQGEGKDMPDKRAHRARRSGRKPNARNGKRGKKRLSPGKGKRSSPIKGNRRGRKNQDVGKRGAGRKKTQASRKRELHKKNAREDYREPEITRVTKHDRRDKNKYKSKIDTPPPHT